MEESESQENIILTDEEGTADNSPADTADTDDQSTEEVTEQPKPGPSQEDYKAGMFKYKNLYEGLKLEKTTAPLENNSISTDDGQDDQSKKALEVLGQLIDQRLAPLKSSLEKQDDLQATEEIMSMKYSSSLEPEIREEFKATPGSLPFRDRLKMARNTAIANNIDKIAQVNQEIGIEQGYSNKKAKQQNNSVNTGTRTTNTKQGWRDKLENGEALSDTEYRANRTAILDWEKSQRK